MLTLTLTLGLDAEDAALNRPALILRPPEVADILDLLVERPSTSCCVLPTISQAARLNNR